MTLPQVTTKSPKPFLKWVGGKAKLAPQLHALMPKSYKTFHEPFAGGGALFFYAKPTKAWLNDINPTLMGAFQNIKDKPDELIDCLQAKQAAYYTLTEEERRVFYYQMRNEFNAIKNPASLQKSCLLIFINKTCYNGMYRENSTGGFNVPFGNYKQPNICDFDTIQADSQALQNVRLSSDPFENIVKNAKKGDFIYFDPPYHPLTKTSSFTGYSESGFNEADQVRLKDTFDALHKKGCFVMLSNSSTSFIKDIYADYRQETVMAARAINSQGAGRGKIEELVILNYWYGARNICTLGKDIWS